MSQYYPLYWHEQKLAMLQADFARGQKHLAEMKLALKVDRSEIAWLDYQIREAKRMGQGGFDATQFCRASPDGSSLTKEPTP